MQVQITNYRGVGQATIDLSKIALIAGPNGAGKSSACQAVAAALTGEPMPIDDDNGNALAESKAGVLVRAGTAAGRVQITSDTGTSEVVWPSAKVSTTGAPACASRYAAGLDSIVTMPLKDRTKFLIDYLQAQPTKEDLMYSLRMVPLRWEVKLPHDGNGNAVETIVKTSTGEPFHASTPGGPDGPYMPTSPVVDKLWELITTAGWGDENSGAYGQIKEKGAKYKGQWELTTNAGKYGAKKAESWIPEGYSSDLMGASEDTLKAVVTDARDALEAAIAASAVDDSKRAEIQALADTLPDRQRELDEAKKPLLEDAELKAKGIDLQEAKQKLTTAQSALTALNNSAPKKGDPPKELFCSCGKKLMLDAQGNLCEYTTGGPTQEELDAHGVKVGNAKREVISCEAEVAKIQGEYDTLATARSSAVSSWNSAITLAAAAVSQASAAVRELADRPEVPVDTFNRSIDDCRTDLAAHELRLKAFTSKHAADTLHSSIELNQELLKHIAPGGVRAEVLQHALGNFNVGLAGLCSVAGYPVVQIERDFSWSFSGTPYYLASGGEQYRVRTVVQMAMAIKEHAGAVICDGADILDKAGRNGLFKLLKSVGIPALVGTTILGGDTEVPALGKAGYGVSYWLEGAVAREVV